MPFHRYPFAHYLARRCKCLLAFVLLWLLISSAVLVLLNYHSSKLHREDEVLRAKLLEIMYNQNRSRMRLEHLLVVSEENSEELPRNSFFGTFGSLDSICQGNDSARCVRPFRNLETRLRFAPKYRIVACIIQKSMSMMLQAIVCLLFDEHRFIASGRNLNREWGKIRMCKDQNELNQFDRLRAVLSERFGMELDSFALLAIVRDPVERFLSGFVDKCVRHPHSPDFCLGCQSNLTCFVMREYARMMSEAGRFRMAKTFEDMHFFPQNWRCNFRSMMANYSLIPAPPHPSLPSNSSLTSSLVDFFRKLGVNEEVIGLIGEQTDSPCPPRRGQEWRTFHATRGTKVHGFFEQRLRGSPFLMEFIVRMFYHDFRLFGFPIPKMHFDE